MKGKIYILLHPDTKEIKYVGMTKLSLRHRLSLHLTEKKKITYKSYWIAKLKKEGKVPLIQEIDNSDNLEELSKKEVYWIKYYLDKGVKLTNTITTFSARPYSSFLDKTAKKVIQYDLKGNKIAEFESAGDAACQLGYCDRNGTIYKICNGKKNSTFKGFVFRFEGDTFDKYPIIRKGQHFCPDYHKKYLSEKAKERNSKFTKEHYIKMREAVKNRKGPKRKPVEEIKTGLKFDSIKIASDFTKVPKTTILRHCNNTVKKPLFKFQDIV